MHYRIIIMASFFLGSLSIEGMVTLQRVYRSSKKACLNHPILAAGGAIALVGGMGYLGYTWWCKKNQSSGVEDHKSGIPEPVPDPATLARQKAQEEAENKKHQERMKESLRAVWKEEEIPEIGHALSLLSSDKQEDQNNYASDATTLSLIRLLPKAVEHKKSKTVSVLLQFYHVRFKDTWQGAGKALGTIFDQALSLAYRTQDYAILDMFLADQFFIEAVNIRQLLDEGESIHDRSQPALHYSSISLKTLQDEKNNRESRLRAANILRSCFINKEKVTQMIKQYVGNYGEIPANLLLPQGYPAHDEQGRKNHVECVERHVQDAAQMLCGLDNPNAQMVGHVLDLVFKDLRNQWYFWINKDVFTSLKGKLQDHPTLVACIEQQEKNK